MKTFSCLIHVPFPPMSTSLSLNCSGRLLFSSKASQRKASFSFSSSTTLMSPQCIYILHAKQTRSPHHLILSSTLQAPKRSTRMSSGEPQLIQQFKYSKRVVLKSILGRDDRGLGLVGERVVVGGWVKAKKEKHKNKKKDGFAAEVPESNVSCYESLLSRIPLLRLFARVVVGTEGALAAKEEGEMKNLPYVVYLRINDGSCAANLQVLVDSSMSLVRQVMSTGSSILVEGVLEQPLAGGKHAVELKVSKILHVGVVDSRKYPLAKPRLTLEFLRAHPHFRSRTTTIASVTRIQNTLSYATHKFFQTNGFLYVHMPIITTTDEGTSTKKFQVTTLLSKPQEMRNLNATNEREAISLEAVKKSIKEKSAKVEELQRSDSNKEALLAAIQDLQKANELVLQLQEKPKATSSSDVEELDFSKDFFSCPAYLSVSSGLHLESYACALSSVYTFGPIFRAEESHSAKNLAEMWMVEVELAFADLEDVVNCAEDFLKFLIQSTLNDSSDDMNFISKRIDQYCVSRLQSVCSDPFARVTYAEALEILKKATDKTFETELEWGISLSEEHESYLANEFYKKPVIIYEYPKEVKPFYVHIRDDGRTACAFDIIAPKVGVLVRGSQKEENIDKISARMEELGLARGSYEWYLDLRRHGRVKHSGFSLMFEKMVMFATGLDNIKDAIPFPRSYGSAHT